MTIIFYYSRYCNNCSSILSLFSKIKDKSQFSFVCIDKRASMNNEIYAQVNGKLIQLPKSLSHVPAILIEDNLIFGNKALEKVQQFTKKESAVDEPSCYSLNQLSQYSDNYSFLDQDSEEMSAKGSGGLRQIHNFSLLSGSVSINTPEIASSGGKVTEGDLEKYKRERDSLPPIERKHI
tara:strand:- start:45 stop:581 length:537 start_codon:yes stop_codon:yes gene_type:complete